MEQSVNLSCRAETAGQRNRPLSSAARTSGLSRSALQALVAEGVQCNGKPLPKPETQGRGHRAAGDRMQSPSRPCRRISPLDIVLRGLPSAGGHQAQGHGGAPRTPATSGRHAGQRPAVALQGSLSGIGGEIRPGIVHRIDRTPAACWWWQRIDATHIGLFPSRWRCTAWARA